MTSMTSLMAARADPALLAELDPAVLRAVARELRDEYRRLGLPLRPGRTLRDSQRAIIGRSWRAALERLLEVLTAIVAVAPSVIAVPAETRPDPPTRVLPPARGPRSPRAPSRRELA